MTNHTHRTQVDTIVGKTVLSEDRLRSIFQTIPVGIGLESNQEIIEVNSCLCRITGYKRDELIGKNVRMLYSSDEELQRTLRAIQQQIAEKGTGTIETRFRSKTGDIRDILLGLTPLERTDLSAGTMFSALDITGQKRVESERLRLMSAVEQADEAFVITDTGGTIQYVNPAFERVTGYSSSEVIGGNPRILKSGKHNRDFYRHLWQTILSGDTWRGRITNARKDGSLYIEEAVISPVFDSQGKAVNFVAVKHDISSEIKMEEKLRHAQRMESIGTLAGGIAHDFNNILSAIIGYTQLALDDTAAGMPVVSRHLSEIMQASRRAKNLVAQILAFSRQTDAEVTPVQIHLIVKEVLKMLRATLPSFIDVREEILSFGLVMADASQIHQLVMNLCTNAFQAMKDEGGYLKVMLSETEVRLSDDHLPELAPGRYLRLAVEDSGVGIAPEILERIFDPYFTTKEPNEGTGLGLSVVFGIVQSHGGTIDVRSEIGKGSRFTVFLPMIEAPQPSDETVETALIPTGTERILLVDDESALVEMGHQMLQRMGYRVEVQSNSMEALERFRAGPQDFDLVITDLMMPYLTGDRLSHEIHAIRPDIPIILCTGYRDRIDEKQASAMGIQSLVMKPVLMSEMAKAIREVLDRPRPPAEQEQK